MRSEIPLLISYKADLVIILFCTCLKSSTFHINYIESLHKILSYTHPITRKTMVILTNYSSNENIGNWILPEIYGRMWKKD